MAPRDRRIRTSQFPDADLYLSHRGESGQLVLAEQELRADAGGDARVQIDLEPSLGPKQGETIRGVDNRAALACDEQPVVLGRSPGQKSMQDQPVVRLRQSVQDRLGAFSGKTVMSVRLNRTDEEVVAVLLTAPTEARSSSIATCSTGKLSALSASIGTPHVWVTDGA